MSRIIVGIFDKGFYKSRVHGVSTLVFFCLDVEAYLEAKEVYRLKLAL